MSGVSLIFKIVDLHIENWHRAKAKVYEDAKLKGLRNEDSC